MDKKLPKVFANKIEKNLNNNERVYVASKENVEEIVNDKKESKIEKLDLKGMNVKQKIRSIFGSKNYIYKANVIITRDGKKESKKIIGKNNMSLITIDNELILIDTIEDIELEN